MRRPIRQITAKKVWQTPIFLSLKIPSSSIHIEDWALITANTPCQVLAADFNIVLRPREGDGYRGFHGKQCQNLQQVILYDISDDAIAIKIAAATFRPKIFTEDNLNISDILSTPKWLKHQVGKS